MAGITDYLSSKLKALTPQSWDGFVRAIDVRLRNLEGQLDIERRVTDTLLQRGVQVIEDGIGPSIIIATEAAANVAAIADLGMLMSAPSNTTMTIGSGVKLLTVLESRRAQFAPAAIVMAYAGDSYANSIVGEVISYNRVSGELQISVLTTSGAGVHNAWTITPIASTVELEALRVAVETDKNAAATSAGQALGYRNTTQSALASFVEKYLGAAAADPTLDGNGNAVAVGAIYTNSVTGKLRYRSAAGWQDTISGSNVLVHTFTTDARGTAAYALPEAPGGEEFCFVILDGDPLRKAQFNVSGTAFNFVADPGTGLAVEVTIIGQLAIGTPSNETVGAAQMKAADAAAIRAKIGANRMVGEVIDYAGGAAPAGWLLCSGAAVSRTTYADLFAILGTVYGAGNGTTTFNLPDARGRVIAGKDNMGGVSSNRLATPIDGDVLGAAGGTELHTLTVGQIPGHGHDVTGVAASGGAHTHTVSGSAASAGAHTHTVPTAGAFTGLATNADATPTSNVDGSVATSSSGAHTHAVSGSTNSAGAHTHAVSGSAANTGGGEAHNNVQPTLVLNKIIFAGV